MKTTFQVITCIIISCTIILSCNHATKSAEEHEDLDAIAVDVIDNELNSEPETQVVNEQDKNTISFNSVQWYTKSKDEDIFNGLNTNLMAGVILNYVKKKHLDPNTLNNTNKDSIMVDLNNGDFSFFNRTPSKLSLYDIKYQLLDDQTRIASGDEEISEEELAKRIKEKENTLNQFGEANQHLRNIKTYDVHIIKGSFKILQVKNNTIMLKLDGNIIDIDALTFHAYGENGPATENPFDDEITIDLMEAFNDIGGIHKFTKPDLQVVHSKYLKILRNQFFARKGYIFKTDGMKDYFNKKEWYKPEYEDVSSLLTASEKYNTEFIKQLEDKN